jgi:excisionase family DNA binding protein
MSQASTELSDRERARRVAQARRERARANIRATYFSTAEAAVYLNYSESHFRALVRAGKLPQPMRPYGPNGKCLWAQTVLDTHMHASQGEVAPTAA